MSAPLASWVDGAPAHALPLPDRAVEFGDGLYETLAVERGRVRLLARHCARLRAGCARLDLPPPDDDVLVQEIAAAARVPGAGVVKVVVSAGEGGTGYARAARARPRRLVQAWPARERPAEWARAGVVVRHCALRLAEQPRLAGLKHLNRLEQVLARTEWDDPDVAEGLLSDVHDRVVCGTMTNVFAVLPEGLVTPALERCGVAGVVRAEALDVLPARGLAVVVRDLARAELAGAREIFLTNALIGAWPVRRLAERTYEPGPVCRALQAHLAGAYAEPPC